jgi:penicillin-binding protein-related factor A (putative recombinase)
VVKSFRRGDHVRWNSEAGVVSGVIVKTIVRDTKFKGYMRHASKNEPQYFIKSDKTDHVAVHKGLALRLIGKRTKKVGRMTRG